MQSVRNQHGRQAGCLYFGSLNFSRLLLSISLGRETWREEEAAEIQASISEVVEKFQATANVRFQLKERQVT